jgi:sugar lactone lactonase YvrE
MKLGAYMMISLDSINTIGTALQRPECVLTTANGRLYTADWRGGIGIIEPDGSQWYLLPNANDIELKPNGICLMPDGSFLIAHLGAEDGGIYRLSETGELSAFCLEIDGKPLPPCNYVHLDAQNRVWITVSTRQVPRSKGYTAAIADGFVGMVDQNGNAKIVADNLGYTNECLTSPDGQQLIVNETFARKLTSFDIDVDGTLSNKRTLANFDSGTFPDGLTYDAEGGIWITSIVSNRVIRIAPDGSEELIIEDCDNDHLEWVEDAFQQGEMDRPHLDQARSKKLKNISSLAFGGNDLRTGYLGCLLDESIYTFRSPNQGHPPRHWHFAGPKRSESSTESETI